MDDILGLSRKKPDGTAARIKSLIRQKLDLSDDITLMVSELQCHEDGCPDVETVIAVMRAGQPPASWKIQKPMADITESDINQLP